MRDLAPIGALVLVALLCLGPALGARFVLVDDHEILSYTRPGAGPPLDGLREMIFQSDPAAGRFRPMYWVVRLTEISVLRDNPTAWHALISALGVLSAALLYAAARSAGLNRLVSLLLGAWLLVTPGVSSVWVRLGPNETTGMLFLALSLFAAVRASRATRFAILWDLLFVVASTAALLAKESFVAAAPALAGFRALAGLRREASWSRGHVAAAASVVAIGLALAIVEVGVQRSAGVQSYGGSFLGFAPLSTYLFRVAYNLAIVLYAGVAWLIVLALGVRVVDPRCPALLLGCGVAALAVVPQVLIYSNQGILEGRYELPAALGIVGLGAVGLVAVERRGRRYVYRAGVALFALTIVGFGISTWTYARYFAEDSMQLNRMLAEVTSHTPPTRVIGIAADPARQYEPVLSMVTHLGRYGHDESNVKLLELIPTDQPYTQAETNLLRAIDNFSLMQPPTLAETGCANLGALVILGDEARARAVLPCTASGFRRLGFTSSVPLWGGEAVSLRPRLPGTAQVGYTALLADTSDTAHDALRLPEPRR